MKQIVVPPVVPPVRACRGSQVVWAGGEGGAAAAGVPGSAAALSWQQRVRPRREAGRSVGRVGEGVAAGVDRVGGWWRRLVPAVAVVRGLRPPGQAEEGWVAAATSAPPVEAGCRVVGRAGPGGPGGNEVGR
eukprot:jgi/Ulvmu1/3307/UM153_0019.1